MSLFPLKPENPPKGGLVWIIPSTWPMAEKDLRTQPIEGSWRSGQGHSGVVAGVKSGFSQTPAAGGLAWRSSFTRALAACYYNPGPVPRPQGHVRVMKSSQLRLRGEGGAPSALAGGPSPAAQKRALATTQTPGETRGKSSRKHPDIDQAAQGWGNRFPACGGQPLSGHQHYGSGPPGTGPPDLSHFTLGTCHEVGLQSATSVSSVVPLNKPLVGPGQDWRIGEGRTGASQAWFGQGVRHLRGTAWPLAASLPVERLH